MLFIHRDGEDSIEFGRYLDAPSTYSHRLPEAARQFAGDVERFALNHPKSLHDAWVESLVVKESHARDEADSGVSLELVLLGQKHDRRIRLIYRRVERYEIRADKGGHRDTLHGDLYTHEVRLSEAGRVVHELLFVTGARLEVECAEFEVMDEMLSPSD